MTLRLVCDPRGQVDVRSDVAPLAIEDRTDMYAAAQRRELILGFRPLVDLERTDHRVARIAERQHECIADPLDDSALMPVNRLPHQLRKPGNDVRGGAVAH